VNIKNCNIDDNMKRSNNDKNNFNNQNLKSSGSINLDENALSEKKQINKLGIDESQNERDLIGCRYISKYEELRESMINGDDISNELKTSMSLGGVSKFLVQNKLVDMNKNNYNNYDNNNGNLNDLYVTWKEDNFNNNSNMKTPSKNDNLTSNDNRNITNNISNKGSMRKSNNI
jgi:hypothetical protein